MRRRLTVAGMVALLAVAIAIPGAQAAEQRNHTAHLTGQQEVAAVDTTSQGQAKFQFNKDFTEMRYRINVANIDDVIGIHIHRAPAGENGPIVLGLLGAPFIPDPGLSVNGSIVTGTATAADLSGPLAGMTLADLAADMADGATYVNVHTVVNRPGEIRGQIK